MATVQVFWSERGVNFDEDSEYEIDEREVRTGIPTDHADYATSDAPVVVEDLTGRVYLPDDLRPDTILFIEAAAGVLPPIAEAAVEAGYHVAHADKRGRTSRADPQADQEAVEPRIEESPDDIAE